MPQDIDTGAGTNASWAIYQDLSNEFKELRKDMFAVVDKQGELLRDHVGKIYNKMEQHQKEGCEPCHISAVKIDAMEKCLERAREQTVNGDSIGSNSPWRDSAFLLKLARLSPLAFGLVVAPPLTVFAFFFARSKWGA